MKVMLTPLRDGQAARECRTLFLDRNLSDAEVLAPRFSNSQLRFPELECLFVRLVRIDLTAYIRLIDDNICRGKTPLPSN
jgi:hypothetical protein